MDKRGFVRWEVGPEEIILELKLYRPHYLTVGLSQEELALQNVSSNPVWS
jgi:hypothetical protein